jgi:hypothetical protein
MRDILRTIAIKKLDKRAVAEALFPKALHPLPALNRVANGEAELSAEQYRIFSNLTGIPIGFLVSQDWLVGSDKLEEIFFMRGDIIVKLNTKDYITVVHQYKDGVYKPLYEVKAENAPLNVFLQDLIDLVISGNVTNLKSIK